MRQKKQVVTIQRVLTYEVEVDTKESIADTLNRYKSLIKNHNLDELGAVRVKTETKVMNVQYETNENFDV